ncbi:MAG: nitroreductase [Gammaproteobacteria bacterium]|nr:nitroreductase [Gammaproteobacteria bacterium]MBF68967.1 nitroreductase [Gammaproteobacteria bacterium]
MEFDDVVMGRRSIRGYKTEPVSKEVIREVVALATRAPSSMNTQPWHLHVVTGDALDAIRKGNTENNLAGVAPSREIRQHGRYEGVHRDRQKAIAVQLFDSMSIAWGDKERRQDWVMRGFRQFDAPVSIVVCCDKELDNNDIAIFDCGAVVNGLVNAAWSKGLGAVINGQGIMQSPVVREHAGIPDDQFIVTCVAMGWPEDSFDANSVVSTRRPVNEVVNFVGFE